MDMRVQLTREDASVPACRRLRFGLHGWFGGARGDAPGRRHSTQTMWPCLQTGQSRSDRPVNCA